MPFLILSISLLLTGCRHKIRIESNPPGATVYLRKKNLGTTPIEQSFWWWPGRSIPLRARLPLYRTMYIKGGTSMHLYTPVTDIFNFRLAQLFGTEIRYTHTFLLVRSHGSVGTWTPEDAKKSR